MYVYTLLVGESHVRAVTNDLKSLGNVSPHKKDVKQHKYTYQIYLYLIFGGWFPLNIARCDGSIWFHKTGSLFFERPYVMRMAQKKRSR